MRCVWAAGLLTFLNLLAAIASITSMEREINEQRDKLLESQKCEAHSSSRWAHLAAQFAGLQRALGVEHDDADEVGSRRRYGDGSHRLLVDADGVTGVCTGMKLRP